MSVELKKNYETLEEAFAALPEELKKHSERVSAYTKIIYLQAIASEIYPSDDKVKARLKAEYADVIADMGLFHDIGKLRIAEEYRVVTPDFGPEETAIFEKHAADGSALVKALIGKTRQYSAFAESMVVEGIGFHHEEWNGVGFPNKLSLKNIPFLARILHLADCLDHMLCETHTENPYEDTVAKLMANEENRFDPTIVALLKPAGRKIKKIFSQNLEYTVAIPKVIPFIQRHAKRPFELWYRPLENRDSERTVACEAAMKFKIANTYLSYGEVEEVLKKDPNLRQEMAVYATYEACDMIRRIDACEIPVAYVVLNLPYGMLNNAGMSKSILTALSESDISPDRLCLSLTAADFQGKKANLIKNLEKLRSQGIRIMCTGMKFKTKEMIRAEKKAAKAEAKEQEEEDVKKKITVKQSADPEITSVDELLELNVSIYRLGADDAEKFLDDEFIGNVKKLMQKGITIMADGIVQDKNKQMLDFLQINVVSGPLTGEYVNEDTFITTELEAMKQ